LLNHNTANRIKKMSSLLQFGGKCANGKVHLEFYQIVKVPWIVGDLKGLTQDKDTDGIFLPGGKWYPRIWTAPRKPKGMFGCWAVFEYNGKDNVPDLSCPIAETKLPRDAKPIPIDECIARWKS